MTREEALNDWLPIIRQMVKGTEVYTEALDMAIKALEQEPCADMVSRDAMWDVLQKLYGTEGELVEELMSLPPVLPMPKIGKWEYDGDQIICSQCKTVFSFMSLRTATNYCSVCGSYNGGSENDD